ncbi:DUF1700 domain-containing protein [uncultured Clostridium sp.]|jgi:uncharacterized membrane protein|uniref:DUF1700 domain-containing protein n=2 Tax=Clostridium TaxID=1485 RepID=UPI0026311852|nr:DUF1700 domain-containing protein [uncultured Clostridium sp.]
MTKSTFIENLRVLLKSINEDERNKFISYYEEIFDDYMENGFTEEEVINKIGSPESIANSILEEQDSLNIKVPSFNSKILNTVLLILGFPLWGSLLLTVALIILSIYIIIFCVPFTTGVMSVSFFGAGLFGVIASLFLMFDGLALGIVQLGVCISLIGASILLGIITLYVSKKVMSITSKLTLKIVKSFKRKEIAI